MPPSISSSLKINSQQPTDHVLFTLDRICKLKSEETLALLTSPRLAILSKAVLVHHLVLQTCQSEAGCSCCLQGLLIQRVYLSRLAASLARECPIP